MLYLSCMVVTPVSGKCFVTAYHLMRHESVHTKEKPYECEKYDNLFMIKDNMRVHQTTHIFFLVLKDMQQTTF